MNDDVGRRETLEFTLGEVTLLQLALIETIAEIDEWEFGIRLGWSRGDAIDLIARLEPHVAMLRHPRDEERNNKYVVELDGRDRLLLHNGLNEAQNGFASDRFAAALEASEISLDHLFQRLKVQRRGGWA